MIQYCKSLEAEGPELLMLAASEPWPCSPQVLQEGEQILHGLVLHFDCMFMACVVTFHCRVLPRHATTCHDMCFGKEICYGNFQYTAVEIQGPHP